MFVSYCYLGGGGYGPQWTCELADEQVQSLLCSLTRVAGGLLLVVDSVYVYVHACHMYRNSAVKAILLVVWSHWTVLHSFLSILSSFLHVSSPAPFPPLLGLSSMPTCQHSLLQSQGLSQDGSSRWIKRLITKPLNDTHATHAHTFPYAKWCRREWGSMTQMSSTSPTWYWMPGEGVDIVSLQNVYTYGYVVQTHCFVRRYRVRIV